MSQADGDGKPHQTDVTSALCCLPLIVRVPVPAWYNSAVTQKTVGAPGFSLQLMPRIRNEKLCYVYIYMLKC